jgi:hypothetical protein
MQISFYDAHDDVQDVEQISFPLAVCYRWL